MLTPPPVGYLGGGPTYSPPPVITSCLAACLEAGVGCVCPTLPEGLLPVLLHLLFVCWDKS